VNLVNQLPDLWLPPHCTITLAVTAMAAGDQLSTVTLLLEYL